MQLSTIIETLWERGDDTIHDVASEYGEPGYSANGPILMGDWWCRRADCSYPETYDNGGKKVHAMEYHYPRVFAFLETEGCELEWYDEWTVVDNKAYRTEADSYSWQPTAVFNSDTCEYMISGENIEEWLEWVMNDASRCLMRDTFSDAELSEQGFEERECGFESGWYGQEDNPAVILEAIQEREPRADVVFKLSDTEQFRVTFCVFVRTNDTNEEDEEE